MSKTPTERLQAIGIEDGTITNILKNKQVTANFMEVLDLAEITECPKAKGALLYAVTTKVKPLLKPHLKAFVVMVVQEKWNRVMQLDEGIKWLETQVKKHGGDSYQLDQAEFEAASGVGVVITEQMIEAAVQKLFEENKDAIASQKHDFNFAVFLNKMKDVYKWADGGQVRQIVEKQKIALLGEAPPKEEGAKKKKAKPAPEAKPAAKAAEDKQEEETKTIDIKQLIGRDVDTGNSAEELAKHNAFTGGRVMTRFPPEPNGYLHIGHAKSIRFNFTVAKEYGGDTYLRFDDTNPCKENNEFIDHIKEIVDWLGYKPWKTTASSNYF